MRVSADQSARDSGGNQCTNEQTATQQWNPDGMEYGGLEQGTTDQMVRVQTADGREIQISRAVLEECSMFFRTLFNSKFAEENAEMISLANITAEALQQCIALSRQFSHGDVGMDDISLRTACHAFDTASYLSMDELIEKLSDIIMKNLDPKKLLEVYRFVQQRCASLASRIWNIIVRDFDKVVTSGGYTQLSRDEMEKLMKEEWLNLTTAQEAQVVEGWATQQGSPDAHAFREFAHDNMRLIAEDQSTNFVFKRRIPTTVLLALGGWSPNGPTNLVETYNHRTNTWISAPPNVQEQHRAYHGMVMIGDKIYVIGGFNGTEYFPHTKVFSLSTMQWEERSAMHDHRCYVSTVAYDTRHLVACGGFNGSERLRSAEMYQVDENQWYRLPDMNRNRSDACSVHLGNSVYTIGGFDGHEIHNTMESYDPVKNTWLPFGRGMHCARTGVSAAALTTNVVVVCGGFNGTSRLKTAEFCDVREGLWHKTNEMATTRSNFAVSLFRNDLMVCGGFDGNRTTAKCERFDIRANRWFDLPPMSMAKSALRVVTLENHDIIPNLINYH